MDKINISDFKKRAIDNFYLCVYVIDKQIKIRTDSCIEDRLLYVFIGIDLMGKKKTLGMYLYNPASTRFWLDTFESIQGRGLNEILFFVTPSDKGIERALKMIYTDTVVVHSPENISNNITKFFSDKTSKQIQRALRKLFTCETKEVYESELALFKETYVNNKVLEILVDNCQKNMTSFYQYGQNARKLFYPYYMVNDFKKFLNKLNTKDTLCSNLNEIIEFCLPYINSFEVGRFYTKSEWLELLNELYETYSDKIGEYLWVKKN